MAHNSDQIGSKITVSLLDDLAGVNNATIKAGIIAGRIIQDQLEKARDEKTPVPMFDGQSISGFYNGFHCNKTTAGPRTKGLGWKGFP